MKKERERKKRNITDRPKQGREYKFGKDRKRKNTIEKEGKLVTWNKMNGMKK
jgi:hypothetical protein